MAKQTETILYKHNYKARLLDLNMNLQSIISDFYMQHKLIGGKLYRIETVNGETFEGFFNYIKVGSYSSNTSLWCSFYKMKKDFTPSKRLTGEFIQNIKSIKLLKL